MLLEIKPHNLGPLEKIFLPNFTVFLVEVEVSWKFVL